MINREEVQHIAKLARLGITKKEEEKFQKDLSSILDYFNSLQELDVFGIEPTFHSTEHILKRKLSVEREDEEKPQTRKVVNQLIDSAPDKKDGYIKVKAVF